MSVPIKKKFLTNNNKPDSKENSGLKDIIKLLKPYWLLFSISLVIIVVANTLNLLLPRLIGDFIDQYNVSNQLAYNNYVALAGLIVGIFVLATVQVFINIYLSELMARDMRRDLMEKISKSSYRFVNETGPNNLLTNFTSDISNVKSIASQGIVYFLTAIILLIGSCVMLFLTNTYLAMFAVGILPIVIVVFIYIFSRVTPLFSASQENIGKINQVVNENIFASSLVRILNSQGWEQRKFSKVNANSRDISLNIVNLFSLLIPTINLVSNMAVVLILYIGGRQIISNQLTVGEFTSFITYFNLLITPIFILGFTSQSFARGLVSFTRIQEVMKAQSQPHSGNYHAEIKGGFEINNLELTIKGDSILDNLNFTIKAGSKTAILGPTGAGKSQLFNLLIGLNPPTSGKINLDGVDLQEWSQDSLLSQVGIVFQDSLVFQGNILDNISFSEKILQSNIDKAIYTSKLDDLILELPDGLMTQVSERGSSLSGGQKQRLMLARSLVLNPKVLLLDDFTARVDNATEREIWQRLKDNYPQTTLISITQKIDSIKDFDQIIVLMEGELIGIGTHDQLLKSSPEYKQIYQSQQTV